MKIAVFHNLPFGGAKRVLFEQIKNLSKKHDIYLFQLSQEKDQIFNFGEYCKEINTYKFDAGNKFWGFLKRLYTDYRKFIVLKRLHKNIAKDIDSLLFDIVLVHPDHYSQSPYLLRFLKTKKIYYCHELLRIAYEKDLQISANLFYLKKWYEKLFRFFLKHIDKYNARCADLILVNSKYIRDKVRKYYKKPSIVCYPGVDLTFFKNLNLSRSNILFFGNSKTYDIILSDNLIKRKYRIKNISFKDKIVSDENLRQQYNNAAVTVCITSEEPFGMIPLESMACQTPVIAVNDGGYMETVVDNKTGFLVKNDRYDIEKALSDFLLNPDRHKNMGRLGRINVEKKFTWTNHISILEDSFNKLL